MKKALFIIIGVGLLFFLCISMMLNIVLFFSNSNGNFTSSFTPMHLRTSENDKYEESWIQQGYRGHGRIAVVELYGVIGYSQQGSGAENMVDEVVGKLKFARENHDIDAIILRIDSPGGEVTASDVLYHEIKKTDEIKPVIVYMDTVAASGGYYSAIGGRHIMANELTITGSIGVIMQSFKMEGLSEKIGVSMDTYKSGKLKDLLNPFRETNDMERQVIQSLIDETYNKFVGLVASERNLKEADLRKDIADGRIFSGKQALKNGLIDQTGYFEDAIDATTEIAELGDTPDIIRIQSTMDIGNFLRLFGRSSVKSSSVRLELTPEALTLEPGKFYYVSPHVITR